MGFMDKVRSQATQLAEKAQEGLQTGKEKLDVLQERKRAQGLLQELGALVYRQHTSRAADGTAADIERLVGDLQKIEADGVDVLRDADGDAADKPAEGGSGTDG
jgi:hypothetical protein